MIWLVVTIIIMIMVSTVGLILALVYSRSNQVIEDLHIAYNDFVKLEDGRVKRVYSVMDIKAMQLNQDFEPIYPDDLMITDYHSYKRAPEFIRLACEDKALSSSQLIQLMHQIQIVKRSEQK